MIYNIVGSGIFHKPHFIFKSKSQEFHNKKIGFFRGNENRMARYFMGVHRYLRMQKFLQANLLSEDFIVIPTNNKFEKSVRYIHDNNSW